MVVVLQLGGKLLYLLFVGERQSRQGRGELKVSTIVIAKTIALLFAYLIEKVYHVQVLVVELEYERQPVGIHFRPDFNTREKNYNFSLPQVELDIF